MPLVKPMTEPVLISLTVCLFKLNLAHAIRIVKRRNSNPANRLMGMIKKDKKILNETCSELLIK